MSANAFTIRRLTCDDDLDAFGRLVVGSYGALRGAPHEPEYELELRDVARRVELATVFGAFAGVQPVGCVTFVADASSPFTDGLERDESSFRMLAVDTASRERGVGEALVRRCLDAAAAHGSAAVAIHSGTWMRAAHRLYCRLGFRRQPHRDVTFGNPPHTLLGFHVGLTGTRPTTLDDFEPVCRQASIRT